MKILVAVILTTFLFVHSSHADQAPKNIYDFTVKTNSGEDKKLSDYKGHVLMIVNTASLCGFTPQYKGLEALYEHYKNQGFVILAFPENNFHNQEPGTNEEIKNFCTLKYNTTFPLFAKISVKGSDIAPLYQYLTTQADAHHEITWNFNKFLVNKDGKVVKWFGSRTTPESPEIDTQVKQLLAQ